MKYFNYRQIVSTIVVIAFSTKLLGQTITKFIEPNISFKFDTTKIKITNRYSNTTYKTESYDFKPTYDTINKVRINVSANQAIENPTTVQQQEKMMQERIANFKTVKDNRVTLIEYDKKVRKVGEFLCVGFTLMDNASKTKITTIMCNHISKSDITEVKLSSRNRKSLEQDYKILEQFFKGFKTYTKEELNLNDSISKSKYTIIVETAKDTIENFKYRRGEYFAVVKTKEKLEDKLKEVNVVLAEEEGMLSVENFTPKENGATYIACKISEKGIVDKKGYFVIVNSIGRDIKIPFRIKFEKK
jgi:hypothetical protein